MANKVLTIYISSDAIRVAEMQKNNKQVILSNASEITTPAGCFNDGYLLDVTSAAEAEPDAPHPVSDAAINEAETAIATIFLIVVFFIILSSVFLSTCFLLFAIML